MNRQQYLVKGKHNHSFSFYILFIYIYLKGQVLNKSFLIGSLVYGLLPESPQWSDLSYVEVRSQELISCLPRVAGTQMLKHSTV